MFFMQHQTLIESQKDAHTEQALQHVCEQFCADVSFEYYLFAICKITSLSAPEITTITNYPNEWMQYYFEQKLQRFDPVVRYCFEKISPIRWCNLQHMPEYSSPEGDAIFKKAAELGLAYGISIPLKAHTGEICIFSLATANGVEIDRRFNDALSSAQTFATELFNSLTRINLTPSNKKEILTARELECIFWACEGKTTWEMSQILDIAERTVIFHLTSATKKLGAVNRQHAVAKAITSGLIKPML